MERYNNKRESESINMRKKKYTKREIELFEAILNIKKLNNKSRELIINLFNGEDLTYNKLHTLSVYREIDKIIKKVNIPYQLKILNNLKDDREK